MIDANLKEKWLEALESGKYPKGKHHLNRKGHFCCLGVLCEVTGLKPIFEGPNFENNYECSIAEYVINGNHSSSLVPDNWLGLKKDELGNLMNLNDLSDSFEDVIKWIKENL